MSDSVKSLAGSRLDMDFLPNEELLVVTMTRPDGTVLSINIKAESWCVMGQEDE